jgi:hypothetical protein
MGSIASCDGNIGWHGTGRPLVLHHCPRRAVLLPLGCGLLPLTQPPCMCVCLNVFVRCAAWSSPWPERVGVVWGGTHVRMYRLLVGGKNNILNVSCVYSTTTIRSRPQSGPKRDTKANSWYDFSAWHMQDTFTRHVCTSAPRHVHVCKCDARCVCCLHASMSSRWLGWVSDDYDIYWSYPSLPFHPGRVSWQELAVHMHQLRQPSVRLLGRRSSRH